MQSCNGPIGGTDDFRPFPLVSSISIYSWKHYPCGAKLAARHYPSLVDIPEEAIAAVSKVLELKAQDDPCHKYWLGDERTLGRCYHGPDALPTDQYVSAARYRIFLIGAHLSLTILLPCSEIKKKQQQQQSRFFVRQSQAYADSLI